MFWLANFQRIIILIFYSNILYVLFNWILLKVIHRIRLSDFNKKSELIQAIKDIPYEGRGTKTNKAISEFLNIKILFKSCGWVFYWFSFKLLTLFFLISIFLLSFFKNLLSTKPLLKPMVTDLMCPLSSSLLLTVRKALSCENSFCLCAMKNLKKFFFDTWYLK